MDMLTDELAPFQVWGTKADQVEDIPATTDDPNQVSQDKLFPLNFSKSPDSGGQFIERATMNGIFHTLTHQTHVAFMSRGLVPYSEEYCQDTGYPLGAFVTVLYDSIDGILTTVKKLEEQGTKDGITYEERRAFCTALRLQSMTDNNHNSALIRENLYSHWLIDDNNPIGTLMQSAVNMPPPPGYLDLSENPHTSPSVVTEVIYQLSLFPRVATLLKSKLANCTPFKKYQENQFTVDIYAGTFLRVWGNGYIDRDPGRTWDELQDDTMCPLTGAVAILAGSSFYTGYGEAEQGVCRARVWMPVTNLINKYENDPKYAHLKEIGKHNCFKPIYMPTSYQVAYPSYENYGLSYVSFSNESLKGITGHVLTFDSSDHPKTGHEVRPKNRPVKLFIKV